MEKLKKLKIIEDGRICSPEELKKIRGGCSSGYSSCQSSGYMSCSEMGYTSCKPTSLSGYESNGSGTYCGSTHQYTQCVWGPNYGTCGSGSTYSTYP